MDTKMDKKTVKSDDSEINEYKFYQNKSPILIRNLDISKIVVSNKLPFGKKKFKSFIGYKDSGKVRPAYSVHKWLNVKEILMKIDVFTFW